MKTTFALKGQVWKYTGKASWYFVNIDPSLAQEIKLSKKSSTTGWGQIRVKVTIGSSTWLTSLFPGKGGMLVLPVKLAVRKKEGLTDGSVVCVDIEPTRF